MLNILHDIIKKIQQIENRKDESFRVLKKGLAYGLSVAIVAYPIEGKRIFTELTKFEDKDILWILKQNLKKNRLVRMDTTCVNTMDKVISK